MQSGDFPKPPQDQVFGKEKTGIRPYEYSGLSNKGPKELNEDAFFSPDSEFIPYANPSSNFDPRNPITAELKMQQSGEISKILDGLTIVGLSGEQEELHFTPEYIFGIQKRLNDAIAVSRIKGLAIVADGVGGNNAGELASSIATVIIADEVIKAAESTESDINPTTIQNAIFKADNVIEALNEGKTNKQVMATTITVFATNKENKSFFSGIGDSRIYKRNRKTGNSLLMTRDDTNVWRRMEKGALSPYGFLEDEQRKGVYRALNGRLNLDEIEVVEDTVTSDFQVIMVSDGSWEAIPWDQADTKEKIKQIDGEFREHAKVIPRSLAGQMAFGKILDEVNLRGTAENVKGSALVLKLASEEAGKLSGDNVTALIIESPGQ